MVHNFHERLNFSEGIEVSENIFQHILTSVPRAIRIERANKFDDRNGIDYWIRRRNLPSIGIDVKHREFCPIERFGTDDACVEVTNVYIGPNNGNWQDRYRLKPGWTIDDRKRTDLILYTWPIENGSLRYWILYFPFLCCVSQKYWRDWATTYHEKAALNPGYLTLSVYPLRVEIARRMRELTTGKV